MNTPVSFEIAKLLKEKGYNELCISHYDNEGGLFMDDLKNSELDYQEYSAPTIAEVVMWLYEKHDVWVSVNNQLPRNEKRFEGYVSKVILPPYQHNKLSTFLHLTDLYTSPTEAYKAAIEYTLNNLI